MKRLKTMCVAALASMFLCLGFGFAPLAASAETVETSTAEIVSSEEIDSTETSEESVIESEDNEELKSVTLDDILELAGSLAEEAGVGTEWEKAVENLKTAATTKQVTLSTIASAALFVAVVVYILYKKVTDKKFRQLVAELVSQYKEQVGKLNELVDGTNTNSKTEEEIKQEEAELKAQMAKTTEALACLIGGFMHFTEGVALKDGKKAEVHRDCMNALKKIDGEVQADENNQK